MEVIFQQGMIQMWGTTFFTKGVYFVCYKMGGIYVAQQLSLQRLIYLSLSTLVISMLSVAFGQPTKNMRILGAQYLQGEKTHMEQVVQQMRDAQTSLALGIDVQDNREKVEHLQQEYNHLKRQLSKQLALITLYADNEIELGTPAQEVVSFDTLSDDLYVTRGPKVETPLQNEHSLAKLLAYSKEGEYGVQTCAGVTKMLKRLGSPTKDITILSKRLQLLDFLQQNQEVAEQIQQHLRIIATLEDDVVSLWEQGITDGVLTHAPSFSHSTFGGLLKQAQAIEAKMYGNGGKEMAKLVDQLDESPFALTATDAAMRATDAQFMLIGLGMVGVCKDTVVQSATQLGSVKEYLGSALANLSAGSITQIAMPPIVYALTSKICQRLVANSIAQKLKGDTENLLRKYVVDASMNCRYTGEAVYIDRACITNLNELNKSCKRLGYLTCAIDDSNVVIGYTTCKRKELAEQYIAHQYGGAISAACGIISLVVAASLTIGTSPETLLSFSWEGIVQTLTSLPYAMVPLALWNLLRIPTSISSSIGFLAQIFIEKPKQIIKHSTAAVDKQRIALQSLWLYCQEVAALKDIIEQHECLSKNLELAPYLDIKSSIKHRLDARLAAINMHTGQTEKDAQFLSELAEKFEDEQTKVVDVFKALESYKPDNKTSYKESSWAQRIWQRATSGGISAAYHKLLNIKHHFALTIEAVGELDICVTLAQLLKDKPKSYCLALPEAGKQPHMKATGLWNVLLTHQHPVATKSCELGGDLAEHMLIVSGDPYTGKSTFLRSCATALLMAQTIGVAPAEYFSFVPVNRLIVSINRSDNIGKGTSGFTGEQKVMAQIINDIENTNGPCAVFIDELYHHARQDRGGVESVNFIFNNLAFCRNALSFVTTHYKEPVEVAQDTDTCRHEEFERNWATPPGGEPLMGSITATAEA